MIAEVDAQSHELMSTGVNEVIGSILGLVLPWAALVSLLRLGRWWTKAILLVGFYPLVIYSGLFVLAAVLGHSGVLIDRADETAWEGTTIRFYRTNGGATTDYGIIVQHERMILPGILLVRKLDDFYPCYAVHARAIPGGIELDKSREYCPALPEPRKYGLKRFVYF